MVFALFHLTGFGCSIVAIMQTRTEQGATAWALALNTVPIAAVPAWLVFGNHKVTDYPYTREVGRSELRPVAAKLIHFPPGPTAPANDGSSASPDSPPSLHRLAKIGSLPVTSGNSARLLVDGKETFAALLDAISQAEDYILVQFYIFRDDDIGRTFRDALVERARSGVAIHVLVDAVGSMGLSEDFVGSMTSAGIKVGSFMDASEDPNRFQINFRNHRKILVVDGKVAFTGGFNIGDEYLGKDPELTPWRDTHLELRGPIVQCLQIPFVEDWLWVTGDLLDTLDWTLSPDNAAGEMEALCLASGPADPFETCALGFLELIQGAKDRIWIATPYFVPDDKIVAALQMAAMRGVEVRVLLPGLSDSRLVYLSSFSYLEELEKAGVEFHRFQAGFLHQKVMIVDDMISVIGSANLDNRSLRLNFEAIAVVSDPAFNREVALMLQNDFANSEPTDARVLKNKPFWFRFGVRLSRMLAPIQ